MEKGKYKFLEQPLKIINIGVKKFAESILSQEVEVIHIDWTPPAGGDEEMIDLLAGLL